MKTAERMTPAELEREGFRALCDRLGVAGALRYIQRTGLGAGDYTRERAAILRGISLDDLLPEIRRAGRRRKSR